MEGSLKDTVEVSYMVGGFLILFFCVFGIIGNILSVLVLSRTKLSSSFNIFLISLTVADTLHLIVALLVLGVPTCLNFNDGSYKNKTLPWMYPGGLFLGLAGKTWIIRLTIISEWNVFRFSSSPLSFLRAIDVHLFNGRHFGRTFHCRVLATPCEETVLSERINLYLYCCLWVFISCSSSIIFWVIRRVELRNWQRDHSL